jgi:hypothetical protein
MAGPEVYDRFGEPQDLAWLKATYGARYVPSPATSGKKLALAQVHETEGPATITVRVQSGNVGLGSQLVALSWPDAPINLDNVDGAKFLTRYRMRVQAQFTGSDGYTGFGIGTGSYIQDLALGGPHAVWVLHHLYTSDVLDGVGMLGGTVHRGPLQMVFALVDAKVEPVGTPEEVVRVTAWDSLYPAGGVNYNPDAAFAKAARAGLLGVPTTAEGRVQGYAFQGFAIAILWCADGDWAHIQRLSW